MRAHKVKGLPLRSFFCAKPTKKMREHEGFAFLLRFLFFSDVSWRVEIQVMSVQEPEQKDVLSGDWCQFTLVTADENQTCPDFAAS